MANAEPRHSDTTDFEKTTRDLLEHHGAELLHLAAASIQNGLAHGQPVAVDPADYPPEFAATGACFITLKIDGKLRGCIGSPQAHRALAHDVAENGYGAAFRDPRFPNLDASETDSIEMSVSVLSPPQEMTFTGEADLLSQLRPGVDGLIIRDLGHGAGHGAGQGALFLPAVWESLADPHAFLSHLRAKAGLKPDHWSPTFKASRFIAGEYSSTELPEPGALWSRATSAT